MRLLYARCGTVHCVVCDGIVRRDSVDEIADAVLALGAGTRLHALFPVVAAAPAAADEPSTTTAIKRASPRTAAKKAAAKKSACRWCQGGCKTRRAAACPCASG